MAQKIIAGNWKMNLDIREGRALLNQLAGFCEKNDPGDIEVVIAAPFIHLPEAAKILSGTKIKIAAQNCSEHASGAYTGEVSVDMLRSIEVHTIVIGHSERREYYGETNAVVNAKLKRVQAGKSRAIVCVGEKLEDRRHNRYREIVRSQVEGALAGIPSSELENLVLAYEPVWAIGTGETASPEQAQEMHAFIRDLLRQEYGGKTAEKTSILYGGSVKPSNAGEIFSQSDVDGGLIGGASLKYEDFTSLIKTGIEKLG